MPAVDDTAVESAPIEGVTFAAANRNREPVALPVDDDGVVFGGFRLGDGAHRAERRSYPRLFGLANGGERSIGPVGSTLKHGVFYWQLGPGFLGEHRLVLSRADGQEVQVRVRIGPKTFPANTNQ